MLEEITSGIATAVTDSISDSHSVRVAIAVHDKALLLAAMMAVQDAGHVPVLLDPLGDPAFVNRAIDENHARLFVHDLPGPLPPHIKTLCVNPEAQKSVYGPPIRRAISKRAEELALVVYTSGTSGPAKGVARTYYSLLSEAVLWSIELEISRKTSFAVLRPFFYTGGFVLAYATLFAGGSISTRNDNDAVEFVRLAVDRSDLAFLVPAQLERLLHEAFPRKHFSSTILAMGAPCNSMLKQRIADVFSCNFRESWGNSEGLGAITDPNDVWTRPRSIGRAFFCDNLFIRPDSGSDLSTGTLCGESDNEFTFYVSQDADSSNAPGCTVVSEDVGYADEAGYFYILGRIDERVRIGSIEYFIAQVEAALSALPGVVDVAVGLQPSQDPAQACAIVIVEGSVGEECIITAMTESVPGLRHTIVSRGTVPRNKAGKIDRRAVQRELENVIWGRR